jgi:hypothetical protein
LDIALMTICLVLVALCEFALSQHDRRNTNRGAEIGQVFTTAVFNCRSKISAWNIKIVAGAYRRKIPLSPSESAKTG